MAVHHGKLRAVGAEGFAEFPTLRGEPRMVPIGDPWERFVASVKAGWDELDKVQLKEKLLAARRHRAEADGLPNGGRPPYGYRRPVKGAPLAVCEDEARWYRQMVEWAIEGWGPARIAHELTRLNVPTRYSQRGWTATTVRRILASEAQTGRFRARFGGKEAPDVWLPAKDQPAIVGRERWRPRRTPSRDAPTGAARSTSAATRSRAWCAAQRAGRR